MKKLSILLFSVSVVLTSCKDDGQLGLSLENPDDLVGTHLIDSLSSSSATVLYQANSFSDSTNVLLVGTYTDLYVGKVTAKTFFEVRQTETGDLGTNFRCDNVYLDLAFALNSSYEARVYGDTLKPASYFLYKLTESIADKKYLNSEMVAVASTPFVSLENKTYNPLAATYIRFKLDKDFGDELLTYWNDPDALAANLKGFSVQSSGEEAALFTFTTNITYTGLKIVYSNDQGTDLVKTLAIADDAKRFNQVIAERSANISTLQKDSDVLMDTETNGELYMQSGTGLGITLQFPAMQHLLDSLKGATINKAEIVLHIKPNTYTGAATRPTFVNSLVEANNDLTPTLENGSLVSILIDKIYTTEVNPDYTNKTYTIALTSYFQDILLGNMKVSSFFLQPLENGSSVARTVICGSNYTDPTLRPKLRIYYTR